MNTPGTRGRREGHLLIGATVAFVIEALVALAVFAVMKAAW